MSHLVPLTRGPCRMHKMLHAGSCQLANLHKTRVVIVEFASWQECAKHNSNCHQLVAALHEMRSVIYLCMMPSNENAMLLTVGGYSTFIHQCALFMCPCSAFDASSPTSVPTILRQTFTNTNITVTTNLAVNILTEKLKKVCSSVRSIHT